MTKTEFNRNYWCIYSDGVIRKPIGYDTLVEKLGYRIYQVFRKLESNLSQKLIVRPFHGQVYTFYCH